MRLPPQPLSLRPMLPGRHPHPSDAPANLLHRQAIACRPPRCVTPTCPACRVWLAVNFTVFRRQQLKPGIALKRSASARRPATAAFLPALAFRAAGKHAARSRSASSWHSRALPPRKIFSSVSALSAATMPPATMRSRTRGRNRSAWPTQSTDNGAHPSGPLASPLIFDRLPAGGGITRNARIGPKSIIPADS